MVLSANNRGKILPENMEHPLKYKVTETALKYRQKDVNYFKRNTYFMADADREALEIGMVTLERRLQEYAPNSIMQYREYDIKEMVKILDRGYFMYGQRAREMIGRAGQCHRNSAELWELNHKEFSVWICTGYALSKNGMWYQHSWLVLKNDRKLMEVIETTPVRRVAYYGFALTDAEAWEFYHDHY